MNKKRIISLSLYLIYLILLYNNVKYKTLTLDIYLIIILLTTVYLIQIIKIEYIFIKKSCIKVINNLNYKECGERIEDFYKKENEKMNKVNLENLKKEYDVRFSKNEVEDVDYKDSLDKEYISEEEYNNIKNTFDKK